MKKFASIEVFRNVIYILLLIYPIADIFCQSAPETFQIPLKKCWEIADNSIEKIASDNNSLIISNKNGEIKNINKKAADEIWKISIGSKYEPIIGLRNEEILLLTLETQTDAEKNLVLKKIDGQTGIVKELKNFGKIDERLTYSSFENFFSLEKILETDNVTFILEQINSFLKSPKTTSEEIILSYSENYFSISDGRNILYKSIANKDQFQKIGELPETEKVTATIFTENSLFWGDDSGKVFQKGFNNNPIKILRTGSRVSSIQNIGNSLLITSNDNFLYNYSLTKKKVKWKKRLPGRVVISPRIGNNFAVITTSAVSELLFIDLENGKTFNQITMPNDAFIKDFQIDDDSVFILTNTGLTKFTRDC